LSNEVDGLGPFRFDEIRRQHRQHTYYSRYSASIEHISMKDTADPNIGVVRHANLSSTFEYCIELKAHLDWIALARATAMQPLDFAKAYQNKTDEELLRLASVSHQLTEDAKRALSAALLSRGIDSDEAKQKFHREEVQAERRRGRRVGHLGVTRGIGKQRYGRANYSLNTRTRMERFTTTIFVVLFWLPLIPTGTYRVQRKKQLFSSDMVVLEKLPLDWTQVLGVWAVAAVSLLGLTLAYKSLPSILNLFRGH
jgi:hypothetical protein